MGAPVGVPTATIFKFQGELTGGMGKGKGGSSSPEVICKRGGERGVT